MVAARTPVARWRFRNATGAALGKMNLHNVYANGQQVGGLDEAGKLDVLSRLTAFSNSDAGRTQVVVQAGETLQGLAQRVYGNGALWYVIAGANGLEGNEDLVAGASLTVPEVRTSSNDASTFKPYNPGEITGPTSPGLPYIPPPDAGCNTVAMVIMAIVIIVVTIYTAGAASGAMGAVATGTGTAGTTAGVAAGTATATATAAGTSGFAATMATGASALAGGYGATAMVVGGAAGAFAGSVAGQAAGKAMGVVDHFSLRDATQAGLSAGLTAGLGNLGFMKNIYGALEGMRFAQAAVQAVAGQLTSYAASRVAGTEVSFSWRNVAVSAVSAGATSTVMSKAAPALGIDMGTEQGQFAADWMGGVVGGSLAMHASRKLGLGGDVDYGQVLSDAFGNALGNAAAGRHALWASEYGRLPPEPAMGAVDDLAATQTIAVSSAGASAALSAGSSASRRTGAAPGGLPETGPVAGVTTLDTLTVYPESGRNRASFAEWQWRMDYNAWVGNSSQYAKISTGATPEQAHAIYYLDQNRRMMREDPDGYAQWRAADARKAADIRQRIAGAHADQAAGPLPTHEYSQLGELKAIGSLYAGLAKGIVNGVPKLVMGAYSLLEQGSAFNSMAGVGAPIGLHAPEEAFIASQRAIADNWDGTVVSYGSPGEQVGGVAGELLSPVAYGKAIQVGGKILAGGAVRWTGELGGAADNAAPFSRLVEGGGLQAHEDAGGHLLLEHVGQSEQALIMRLADEPKISGSSSFYDRATAEWAISETLDAKQADIAAWLSTSKPQMPITYTLPDNVGITVVRGSSGAVDTSGLRLILRRDPTMPMGYRIHTGFPEQ